MVWAYGSGRGGGFKDGSEDPLVGQHGGNQVNEGRLPRPRIANEEAVFGPPHRREGPRKELPRPREKRVKVAAPVKQNRKIDVRLHRGPVGPLLASAFLAAVSDGVFQVPSAKRASPP